MRWAAGKKRRGGRPRNSGGATLAERLEDHVRKTRRSTINDTGQARVAPDAAPERDEARRRLRAGSGVLVGVGREVDHPEARQTAFMAVRSGGTCWAQLSLS
jgi:hypothetical protein